MKIPGKGRTAEYSKLSARELITLIVSDYHPAILESFDNAITQLATTHKVESKDEEIAFLLEKVKNIYKMYSQHTQKEERFLFPVILDSGKIRDADSEIKELKVFLEELKKEHHWLREEMEHIAKITLEFTCPVNASPSHKLAYAQLNDLQQDISRIAFIEEEFLFPRISYFHSKSNPRK